MDRMINKIKPRPLVLFFDTCAFYPPQPEEKAAVEKLKELERAKSISIEFSYATEQEAMKAPGKAPKETLARILTIEVDLNSDEMTIKNRIRALLFSNSSDLTASDENDVTSLFEAQKYGCDFFVTVDKKHILSKAKSLREQFGIRATSPSECLSDLVNKRDLGKGVGLK